MSPHVPDDLLVSFVEGDVGEQVAVHIAVHLDACPSCATRAAGLEPLAAALAAVEDPPTPPNLAQSVLKAVAEPERAPVLEIGLGAALITSAAILAVLAQSPIHLVAEVGTALSLISAAARGLATGLGAASLPLVTMMVVSLVACALIFRLPSPHSVRTPRRLS